MQNNQYDLFILPKFCWVSIFPTVYEGNTVSHHRRTSQVSAGRLHGGANGGDLAWRHGGQREEESQPAAWPQHPGELPGQPQVRAPGVGSSPPWRIIDEPEGLCRAERCWCWLRGAAAAGLAQLCGLKSQCVVKSHVWCLGVSAPGGPRRAVCSLNHTFEICRIVFGNPLQAKASALMTTARVPASNTDFIFALMPGLR